MLTTATRSRDDGPGAAPPPHAIVRLLDVEPELGAGLGELDAARARRLLTVTCLALGSGPWFPPRELADAAGVLLVDGLVLREGVEFHRRVVQLFGPGDVLDGGALADAGNAWRALEPCRLAVLDDRFVTAARHWPGMLRWFTQRLFEGQRALHTHAAITAMPRVEERLLALMSHLAGRWGRVTPDGIALTLPVTHAVLGQLVGARRPTVSLALPALSDEGLLRRDADGRWLLPATCLDWVTTGTPTARSVAAA
jgi:CRP/FNR family cyclic AMP-dependent transcriptional regulator